MLDEAGFPKAKICASGDLDETLIRDLLLQGAKIDIWGVGTKLITSMDCPALGGVYKLSARMENGAFLGEDYFERLLEEIREIRLSERRFYQKITDIFATSIDYDPKSDVTKTFFATVQNKFHYAIHGMTAPEVIKARVDAARPLMGMTSFKGIVPRAADVTSALNYLSEDELVAMERMNRVLGFDAIEGRSCCDL